jgi:hypothetical protein
MTSEDEMFLVTYSAWKMPQEYRAPAQRNIRVNEPAGWWLALFVTWTGSPRYSTLYCFTLRLFPHLRGFLSSDRC